MDWVILNILYVLFFALVGGAIIEALITFVIEPVINRIKFKRKLKERYEEK